MKKDLFRCDESFSPTHICRKQTLVCHNLKTMHVFEKKNMF